MKKHSPPCVVQESADGLDLIYNLSQAHGSNLDVYLSEDLKRLHIVGEKILADGREQFLWSFNVPENCNSSDITVEERQNIYLIHIPTATRPAPGCRRAGLALAV